MDRRQFLAVLTAAGGSGCLRFGGGGGGTTTGTGTPTGTETSVPGDGGGVTDAPTETRTERPTERLTDTPTETATPEPTATPDQYPPGMSSDGVTGILADQHMNTLAGGSYTTTVVENNITHTNKSTVETRAADGVYLATVTDPDWSTDLYAPAQRQLWRTQHNDEWVYGVLDEPWHLERATGNEPLRGYFAAGNFGSPTETTTNGETRYRVEASSVSNADRLRERLGADEFYDVSIVAEVTPAGIVRTFTAELTFLAADENRQLLFREAVDTTDVDSTSVSEPDWASTSRNAERAFGVSMRDDRQAVTITHDGGPDVPAGARPQLWSDPDLEDDHQGPLATALTEGESLTVYVENATLRHSRDGLPSDADPAEIPQKGAVVLEIGNAQFLERRFEELG